MVILGVLQAQSSPSTTMMAEYRLLRNVLGDLRAALLHEWVPLSLNLWADRLSREVDSTDWTLSPAAFRGLDDLYGPHTIDLFASELNTRCLRFFSKNLTPGSMGVIALRFCWAPKNPWASPPLHFMGAMLDKIIRKRVTASIVAPVWRAQSHGPWRPVHRGCCCHRPMGHTSRVSLCRPSPARRLSGQLRYSSWPELRHS